MQNNQHPKYVDISQIPMYAFNSESENLSSFQPITFRALIEL